MNAVIEKQLNILETNACDNIKIELQRIGRFVGPPDFDLSGQGDNGFYQYVEQIGIDNQDRVELKGEFPFENRSITIDQAVQIGWLNLYDLIKILQQLVYCGPARTRSTDATAVS